MKYYIYCTVVLFFLAMALKSESCSLCGTTPCTCEQSVGSDHNDTAKPTTSEDRQSRIYALLYRFTSEDILNRIIIALLDESTSMNDLKALFINLAENLSVLEKNNPATDILAKLNASSNEELEHIRKRLRYYACMECRGQPRLIAVRNFQLLFEEGQASYRNTDYERSRFALGAESSEGESSNVTSSDSESQSDENSSEHTGGVYAQCSEYLEGFDDNLELD